jgi:hypothetical protein
MRQLRKENGQFASSSEQFVLMEKLMFTLGIALTLVLAFLIIANYLVDAENIVLEAWANMDNAAYTTYVRTSAPSIEEPAVIMWKIAKCESGGTHYRHGTLVKNVNRNGTIDFGKFQINSAWEAKAASMGYNIYLPKGNEAFAYWLYDTRGMVQLEILLV